MPKVIIKLSRRPEFRGRKTLERARSLCILDNSSPPSSFRRSEIRSFPPRIPWFIKSKKEKKEWKWREEGRREREINHGSSRQRNGRLVIIPCTRSRIFLEVAWYEEVVQHVKRKHVRCTKILSSVGATLETLPACSRRKSALGRRNSKHTSPSSRPVHRHPVRMASFCVDEPCSNCEIVNSLFFQLLVSVISLNRRGV